LSEVFSDIGQSPAGVSALYLAKICYHKSIFMEPVLDYLKKLAQKGDKDSRIKLNKINDYIQILSEYGTQAGEPYIKHLTGDIWELRPIKDRILHQFMKKTQKTPTKEVEQAKREFADLQERGLGDE